MMKKIIISKAALFLMCVHASAQGIGERAITEWNSGNQPICQTQVWDIVADSDDSDRVFCASNIGLCIYSNRNWDYLKPAGNPIIRALKYDKGSGRLYSAGVNGFGYWTPDGYGSYEYSPLYINPDFRSFSLDFWRIALYMQKVLFQSQKKIFIYDCESEAMDTLSAKTSFRYLYEAGGRLWVQDGNDLLRLTPDLGMETVCSISGRIVNLQQNSRGMVAAVEREGLILLQDGKNPLPLNAASNKVLGEAKITCCEKGFSGGFLAGTTKSGLFILDENGDITESYPFKGNSILCLTNDKNGNIWAGFNNGAALMDFSSSERYIFDDRIGKVHCMSKYRDGILIGTNKGVFLKETQGAIVPLEQFSGPAWDMYTIGNDVYILHDQGIFRMTGDYSAVPVSLLRGIYKICPLNTISDMYIAGTYSGLDLFCLKDDGQLHYCRSIEGYRGFTRNFSVDEFDNIWMCVQGDGFVCLRLDKDRSRVESKKDFILAKEGEQVFSTVIDGQLVLVAGNRAYRPTKDGELTPDSSSFEDIIQLCGEQTQSITQDGDRFWYDGGCGAGVVERDGSSLSLHTGILDIASASGSGFTIIDGAAFLGFRNGIGICTAPEEKSSPVRLLSATAVGARETRRYRLEDSEFEIPADMNTVQISISGLPSDRRMEYRISSISNEWISTTIEKYLQINSLQSGKHVIEMRAPADTGTCSLTVIVRRPWFLSWPMLFLYLLIVLGSILAAIQIVQHQNRKKQEQLRKELEYLQMKNELLEKERKLATRALAGVQADEELEKYFNEIYNGFTDRIKRQYPLLSKTDLKICIFVKMHLSGKEIADRLNISPKGVEIAKYRLRKKLLLPPDVTLANFISGFDK